MKTIALTGGIGSGKTYVAGVMRMMDIPVYVSDVMAKRLMETDPELISSLKAEISDNIYDSQGRLDRKLLAEMVFSDSEVRRKIESLVHPAVVRDYLKWVERNAGHKYVAFESAILFEAGLNKMFDVTVCVCAPLDVRIQRCMMRDGETCQGVERRMAAQMPQDELALMCDFVIDNSGKVDIHDRMVEILDSLEAS